MPADLAKCETKFLAKLAKVTDKAADDAIACRYRANADQTVTDYDTELQWEKKDGAVGGGCFLLPGITNHYVNLTYAWDDAQKFVSPGSPDGAIIPSFIVGSADWRLATGDGRAVAYHLE